MTKMGTLKVSLLVAGATWVQCVHAQAGPSASTPPVYQPIDAQGIDIYAGTFNFTREDVSIGDLSYTQSYRANGFLDNFRSSITIGTAYIVTIGGSSESFSLTGGPLGTGTFVQNEGSGSTLTYSGGTYYYTTRDGDIYSLTYGFLYPNSITYRDGTVDTFYTKAVSWCKDTGDGCLPRTSSRLQLIRRSNGYALKFNYSDNATPVDNAGPWLKLTNVTAFNMGVDACPPNTDACSFSQAWPSVTYANSVVGANTIYTTTDSLNRTTTYTYNSAKLVGMKSPARSSDNVSISYATSGKVQTIAINGFTWTYGYVDSGGTRTTTVTDPSNNTRAFVSSTATGRLTSATDEMSRTTSYQYDSNFRPVRVTMPEGNYTEMTYDGRGNVTQTVIVPKSGSGLPNIVTTAAFDASCSNQKTCNQPNSTTDARGAVTNYTYSPGTGFITAVTAPAATSGSTRPETRYGYTALYAWYKNDSGTIAQAPNPIYRPTTISTCRTTAACSSSADEVKTTVVYQAGSFGNASNLLLASMISGAGDASLTATTTVAFDNVGNRISIDGPLPGNADTTVFRYDAGRQQIGVISPDPDGTGSLKRRATRLTYNADGQVTVRETGTVNGTSDTDWSAFSSLQQSTATYDSNGRLTKKAATAFSNNYRVMQYSYDNMGRLECAALRMNPATWSSLPLSACTLGTAGSTGPDRITRTSYNAASEATKIQSAYATSDQSDEVTRTYNGNGTLATLTDAQGNKTTYEYDGFDRLSKTRYPDSTTGVGTSSSTDYEQIIYDANGNITSRRLRGYTSDSSKHIDFIYDALNRATLKDLPGSELDVTYSYDLLGRPVSTATSAQTLSFTYDALGRNLTQVGPLGTITYQYDFAGRRTFTGWPDGFYVTYDRLVTGEVSAIRENGAASGIGVLATYTYDDLGRRIGITRGNGATTSYGFDNISRLTSLTHDLAGTGNDLTLGFDYNPAGQIVNATRSNDGYAWGGATNRNDTSSVNGLNQVTSVGTGSLGYDARGNLTSTGSNSYGYSSENLLVAGPSSTALIYDPLLRLYQATSNSASTLLQYDGTARIAEYSSSGILQRRYVFGPGDDEPVTWYEGSGTSDRRWLHADERGSVVAVSGASGSLIAINSYDEYGVPGSSNVGAFQFTGQAWLPDLGLYYYKARMYASRLGRFMQTDPIGYGDGMNWYNYVGADPINNTDPSGLGQNTPEIVVTGQRPQKTGIGVGSVMGGVAGSASYAESRAAKIENRLGTIGRREESEDPGPDIVVTAPTTYIPPTQLLPLTFVQSSALCTGGEENCRSSVGRWIAENMLAGFKYEKEKVEDKAMDCWDGRNNVKTADVVAGAKSGAEKGFVKGFITGAVQGAGEGVVGAVLLGGARGVAGTAKGGISGAGKAAIKSACK